MYIIVYMQLLECLNCCEIYDGLHLQMNLNGQVNRENNGSCPYFYIGDLWESFAEWSAYGAGVPFMLFDKFPITQFYNPYLSGMQIYVKPKEEESTIE